MKLTKAKMDEAQAVLTAILNETELTMITVDWTGEVAGYDLEGDVWKYSQTLHDLYIDRLHYEAGTEPPPF